MTVSGCRYSADCQSMLRSMPLPPGSAGGGAHFFGGPVDDLVQWLGAQLDEDERIARAASLGPWVQSGIGDYGWSVTFGRPGAGVETDDSEQGLADADFIAAHDPARVLREIDAKRQLVVAHAPGRPKGRPSMEAHCQSCTTAQAWDEAAAASNCRTLRLLALPYADRPGYRDDWRP